MLALLLAAAGSAEFGDREGSALTQLLDGQEAELAERREMQITNLQFRRAVVAHIHLAHQGGTAMCQAMKSIFRTVEDHGCNGMSPKSLDKKIRSCRAHFLGTRPPRPGAKERSCRKVWEEGMSDNQDVDFNSFELNSRMTSWFGDWSEFPFASPHIVSTIVVRHPLDHAMSMLQSCPNLVKETQETMGGHRGNDVCDQTQLAAGEQCCWSDRVDNFQLRLLTGMSCKVLSPHRPALPWHKGPRILTRAHLEVAKKVLRQFTIVMDIKCLGANIARLQAMFNATAPPIKLTKPKRKPPRERCGDDAVWSSLEKLNALDIELYEYAQQLAEDRGWECTGTHMGTE